MTRENFAINCACKGIRNCAICDPVLVENERTNEISLLNGESYTKKKIYIFCFKCNQASPLEPSRRSEIEIFLQNLQCKAETLFKCNCAMFKQNEIIQIKGIFIFNNFLSLPEETFLINEMNKSEWVSSQSGRFKQDYGPQVNFKQRKIKSSKFTGLPFYSKFLIERLNQLDQNVIDGFKPVELCNLKYDSSRASCIDPHFDDFWLWGDRLITFSLVSNTFYTLIPGNDDSLQSYKDCEILVPLQRLSLIILNNDARTKWMHSIKRSHISSTRIAITLRELSDEFKFPNEKGLLGKQIEKLALSLKGISTGSLEKMLETPKVSSKTFNTPSSIFDLHNEISICLKKYINFDENDVIKRTQAKLSIVSNNNYVKIKKSERIFEKLIFDNLKEILKKENLKLENVNLYYVNELNDHNISIQKLVDINKFQPLNSVCDKTFRFNIGVKIAEWREFSNKELNFNEIFGTEYKVEDYFTKSLESRNPLRLKYDFNTYLQFLKDKLNQSNQIDMAIKAKSIALIVDTKCLIDKIDEHEKSFYREGFILNDFKLKMIQIQNESKFLFLTAFQNVQFSFVLNDLAIYMVDFILTQCFMKNQDSWKNSYDFILEGYVTKSHMLNKIELKLLNRLILFNLIFECFDFEEKEQHLDLDTFSNVFDFFYLDENLTF